MKILLPNLADQPQSVEDKQSLVLIGANGAGKTR